MLILEFCQVVDVLIHDDVEVIRLVMGRNVGGGECLCHFERDMDAGNSGWR